MIDPAIAVPQQILHFLRCALELATRPQVGQHIHQRGLGRHQLGRQVQQLHGPAVAQLDHPRGADLGHALVHVLQRGFEQDGFLPQLRLAVAGAAFGLRQQALLALELGDVHMGVEHGAVAALLGDDAAPAAARQGHFKRRPGKTHVLLQGRQPVVKRCHVALAPDGPCVAIHLVKRQAHCGSAVRQVVHLHERLVDPLDALVFSADHQPIGNAVKQLGAFDHWTAQVAGFVDVGAGLFGHVRGCALSR